MSKKKEKVSTYPYPSYFGSHKSMLITETEGSELVICQDEFGTYSTFRSRLDNGLTDPARTSEKRLTKLFQSKKREDK
jgi:hypothetical protein